MIKTKKRTLSLAALTLVAAFAISGCTSTKVTNNKTENTIVEQTIVEKDTNITEPDEVVTTFSDEVIKKINAMEGNESLKNALQRIVDSKEDTETCIAELENIYRLAIIPRCATEEEWDSVIHLRNTLSETENPFDVYYELAIYVHTLTCPEEHYENEFGQTECKTLRKEMDIH